MNSGDLRPTLPFHSTDVDSESVGKFAGNTSRAAEQQEFFLPVSGFVWFFDEEVRIIDHPAFQRLGKINQLGQANLVYRGATHKRIEHSMGAVAAAQRMISAVNTNCEKALNRGEPDARQGLTLEETRFVRLGALLHDIGHLAAGHTLEDELCLFGKHDEDARLTAIFDRSEWSGVAVPKTLRQVIDENYDQYLPTGLRGVGISPTTLLRLLVRKAPRNAAGDYDPGADEFAKQQQALSESSEIRLNICANLVGNTICADLIDYITRDWYHVGRVYPQEDRIFQYMEIRHPEILAIIYFT